MSDRVMIVGGGGREHALAWHLAKSSEVDEIYGASSKPNVGIAELGAHVAVNENDPKEVSERAKKMGIDFVIVGPDNSLAAGVVDALRDRGIATFGPTKEAAKLEWSKSWASNFMWMNRIPTPTFILFGDAKEAEEYLEKWGSENIVVKADRLAHGKGVTVPKDIDEAKQAINEILVEKRWGDTIVQLQGRVEGPELSVFAITDGKRTTMLPHIRDYKRLNDNDDGPNTGGMGAWGPLNFDPGTEGIIKNRIVDQAISGLRERGIDYRGVLFVGLKLTNDGPVVIEINCRFGDPETQAMIMALDEDLYPFMTQAANGHLEDRDIKIKPGSGLTVALTASGYPGTPATDEQINGLDDLPPDVEVFYAGAKRHNNRIVTDGGRVLYLATHAETIELARHKLYQNIGQHAVHFAGMQYRQDIAT